MSSEEDLSSDWDALSLQTPIRSIKGPIALQIEKAGEAAAVDLAAWLVGKFPPSSPLPGPNGLTSDILSQIVSQAIQLFMVNWKKVIAGENLAGLIEIILEGNQLEAQELKQFLQALPTTLLDRMLSSIVGTANGVHAVCSIELLRRRGRITEDYTIEKTSDGKVFVRIPQPNNQEIVVWMDEDFPMDAWENSSTGGLTPQPRTDPGLTTQNLDLSHQQGISQELTVLGPDTVPSPNNEALPAPEPQEMMGAVPIYGAAPLPESSPGSEGSDP